MSGPSASNSFAVLACALLVCVVSCGRLGHVPRPGGVPEGSEHDRKTGLWTHTTPTTVTQYFADGKLASRVGMLNGQRVGAWEAWSMDGSVLIASGAYRAGRRDGIWKHFDDRGRLYLTMRYAPAPARNFGPFSHPDYGNENGPYERLFPDGKLEERGEFRGGFYEGPLVRYHKNGTVAVRGAYRRDLMHGLWTFYYPEGAVERTETYVGGLLEGRVTNYHPDGTVYQVAEYQAGKKVRVLVLRPSNY